ncbi:30S ribosomal protein S20 [Candidatus Epulonipiscium fishelsonii]|uniref:30S ribosomal protein S20 n=1 Tax=Candidatus Epulonipiscium fishelsonii TaxID=77094 RepID=A0ACC8XHI9_9FIRM|nr:30S ribosomal protein S20 [Epulopiscium sp. SCG-D08WGA-EpuloA1]OON95091.1 MAG: 30S ribosomal protein S20 [Epulopiscium sp. AS2M-Bin002]
MANIKSSKKRIKVIATKTARNRAITSAVKTYSKKVISAVQAKDKELAQAQLKIASKKIDQATSKGIFHANTAGRKKSKLQKLVNKIA